MIFNEYQKFACETICYPKENAVSYTTLGLNGEAGEVAEKVKKIIRDNNGQITEEKAIEIKKELGDVMWYLATLSYELGFDLDSVAEMNINKLRSRAERNKIHGDGDNR